MSLEPARGVVAAVCTVHTIRDDDGRLGHTGIDKRPRTGGVPVTVDGLEQDVICDQLHHGGRDQAVYAYARSEAQRWAVELNRDVPPGWFGENLAVDAIAVTDAVIGERWRIGGGRDDATVLEVTMPRVPCQTFGRWVDQPHWVKRFTERGDVGAYLRVIQPGVISEGDPIEVTDVPGHGVTVRQLFTATDPAAMTRLLTSEVDLAPKAAAAAQQGRARAAAARRPDPTR